MEPRTSFVFNGWLALSQSERDDLRGPYATITPARPKGRWSLQNLHGV